MPTVTNKILSASECCDRGEFEAAAAALPGWTGIGLRPYRNGQDDKSYAETLQWSAVISVELGLSAQVPIGDAARDMLTESARLSRSASPLVWLGICYYRCGEYSEADAVLVSALNLDLSPSDRFLALRNLAVVRTHRTRYVQALQILDEAATFLDSAPLISKGKFYLQLGLIHRQLE